MDKFPLRRGRSVLVIAVFAIAVFGYSVPLHSDTSTNPSDNDAFGGTYAIGLWGDMPYTSQTDTTQETIGVPNMIADMNSQKLAFTVHDGDLKAGSFRPCNDALYVEALAYLNALKAPAAFTPGDNDWSDCDRAANGGFSSLERLSRERQVFFSSPYTNGQTKLLQEVQSTPTCLGEKNGARVSEPCVENRRWTYKGVTYATLNVPGSCNNLCDFNPDPQEFAIRNVANIAWLRETFAVAKANGSAAVMLIAQANPGWDLSDPTRAPLRNPNTLAETDGQPDGYQQYLLALREEVISFKKPVAYVHGDSHYFRIDRPFLDSQGRRLENFTRVETFGDNVQNGVNDNHWVKVVVDPKSRDVFSYQVQVVPGNRVAVPAP